MDSAACFADTHSGSGRGMCAALYTAIFRTEYVCEHVTHHIFLFTLGATGYVQSLDIVLPSFYLVC